MNNTASTLAVTPLNQTFVSHLLEILRFIFCCLAFCVGEVNTSAQTLPDKLIVIGFHRVMMI